MPDITVIAHNIRSAHNVGSIFRTCEGFGVKKIILSGYTPYPTLPNDTRLPHISEKLTKQIHKTALGAEVMVSFEHYDNIVTWLDENSRHDPLPIVALEQHTNSIRLQDFRPPARLALLLGEEVHGIAPELLSYCETVLEIPMHGDKESFNVSVASGIALYALTI